ncbi:MAG: metal ABC transporter substrate-binding protein, partial [Erysipelotrichaceae bacterium]|nr:metal ABC transporter substrate-binding protein [Erysipelotrichaceae bacterium]
QIARSREDAALVILNGNYALAAGLNVSRDAIAYEKADSSAAKTYVNVLAVKEGNENNEGIQALVKVLTSQEIVDFINNTYEGAVVPFAE